MKNTLSAENMSYREKVTWICLMTTLAVWLPCFAYVFWLFAHQAYTAVAGWSVLAVAVVASALLNGVAFIGVARHSKKVPGDERDAAIDCKSSRNAYYVLLLLLACIVFTPTFWWQRFVPAGLTHQLLLLAYVAAETVRLFTRGLYYRRGI